MSLLPKEEVIGIEHVAHLATGGEDPVLRSHLDAASRFLLDKGSGMRGRERFFVGAGRTKAALAALLGGCAEDVAFVAHASAGLFVAAQGIDWRPGDNVVVERSENRRAPGNVAARTPEILTLARIIRDHRGRAGGIAAASGAGGVVGPLPSPAAARRAAAGAERVTSPRPRWRRR